MRKNKGRGRHRHRQRLLAVPSKRAAAPNLPKPVSHQDLGEVSPCVLASMVLIAGRRSINDLWRRSKRARYFGIPVRIAGREDLLRLKAAAGRPQDRMVLARLRTGK